MAGNLFQGMIRPGMGNSVDTDGIKRLVPVEVIAGLTNYTHAPYIRKPNPYLPSNLMDNLVLDHKRGILDSNAVEELASHMGNLNNMPSEQSRIVRGYNEFNKGLMKIKFRIQDGGMIENYISVMGYITNNEDIGGLSTNATFVPVSSWKHSVEMTANVGIDGLTFNRERMGIRTDYLLNDGSYDKTKGLSALRPMDVLSAASDVISKKDVMEQAKAEGIEIDDTTPIVFGNSSINHNGIVCSKRSNINQSKYSGELLRNALKANINNRLGDLNPMDTGSYTSEMSVISRVSSDMSKHELRPALDDFLYTLKQNGANLKNARGWRIQELIDIFPEFEDAIPDNGFVLLDSNRYQVIDFTEISQVFGTSSVIETVAQEIIFNILDLLIHYGLSGIYIKGSNCDQMAMEDPLSNIELFPANIRSLSNNDVEASIKGMAFCDDLKHQIFTKLNGATVGSMVPLRLEINANLFGDTEVILINPNSEGQDDQVSYQFPTFAPNPYSPIFGDTASLGTLSDSVYSNIRSYILDI